MNQYEEGLTARHVGLLIGTTTESARAALQLMPDVYIDRWTQHNEAGRYIPVYVKVQVPDDCPPPDDK